MNMTACRIRTRNGPTIITNSADTDPTGVTYIQIDHPNGVTYTWNDRTWSNPASSAAVIANIWATAANCHHIDSVDYGPEHRILLTAGELRISVDGTHIRAVNTDGTEHDNGSSHWTIDEWLAEPNEVMGAICGLANNLNTGTP